MSTGESPLERFMRRIAESLEERDHGDLSVHGFVMRRGRRFESQPITPEEWEHLKLVDWRRHQQRQCWRNAQVTALTMPSQEGMTLRYAEGFLRTTQHDFGVAHAWISLNGKVVDTTVRTDFEDKDSPRVMGTIPEGWEYWGVELEPRECTHYLEQHTEIGSLLDDWQCGWPILTRGAGGTA